MFAAYDVIYLMRRIRVVFVKQAILTPIAGAFRDQSPQGFTDVTSQAGCTAGLAP